MQRLRGGSVNAINQDLQNSKRKYLFLISPNFTRHASINIFRFINAATACHTQNFRNIINSIHLKFKTHTSFATKSLRCLSYFIYLILVFSFSIFIFCRLRLRSIPVVFVCFRNDFNSRRLLTFCRPVIRTKPKCTVCLVLIHSRDTHTINSANIYKRH